MTKELQEFNEKVIEVMKKKIIDNPNGSDDKVLAVAMLDAGDPNTAITTLYVDNKYQLAFVGLDEDPTGKLSITDRVREVYLLLTIPTMDSATKLNNWLTVIYNNLKVDEFQDKNITEIV